MIEIVENTELGLLIAFSRNAAEKLRAFSEYSAAAILDAIADDMTTQ